jgi:hypothetical protein
MLMTLVFLIGIVVVLGAVLGLRHRSGSGTGGRGYEAPVDPHGGVGHHAAGTGGSFGGVDSGTP